MELRFSSNVEAITAVDWYFAELSERHYRDDVKLLEDHWNKCTEVKGGYIEYKNIFRTNNSIF